MLRNFSKPGCFISASRMLTGDFHGLEWPQPRFTTGLEVESENCAHAYLATSGLGYRLLLCKTQERL